MEELRNVQRLVYGEWKHIEFYELSQGDIFRMFEPDETPVVDMKGRYEFLATSNPYLNEDEEWQIDTEE